ncbi:Response regulator receiver domain-containing protein [Desulfonatronum thiosulfatophilum]|uniref:Response regulator receiver domain-containing protein n=1 Tax=Desulfonatronum thiosulfatophilum TaxID=617002 RepID=A0A1G6D6F0_9BACT|nr:response regulator [Desulfonatronum thiosulfatophilum]SDB40680.1 Response regulator receiver domain-containing protein [Desulfonatronum thiosulfatophilum]
MSLAKVLLVDDEVPFIETMVKRLSKRDFEIFTANSGQEALDQLDQHHDIDIVVLDVKMPGMDGIATLKEIKNRFPLIEVIMLTAHATVESAIDGMKLGAFDYLMKPAEIEDLVEKVKQAEKIKRDREEKIREAEAREITSRRG